jgi:hypothetical protein
VIELNPKKHGKPHLPKQKSGPTEGQQAISAYEVNGQKLFNASAASRK